MLSASAPAKIILFGEHAVVYGQPALAVPVASLRATAQIDPAAQPEMLEVVLQDMQGEVLRPDTHPDHPIMTLIERTQERIGQVLTPVRIVLSSSIPIASGLGSGAAVSTAVARVLLQYANVQLSNADLNQIIYEVEKTYHGTPSGIDNTVIVYEQPVFFVRGAPLVVLRVAQPVHLVVADTGEAALTRVSVGDVRQLYEAEPERITPMLERIGQIGRAAREQLEQGRVAELGPLMDENHALLRELTVSSTALERLVAVAKGAGALGAKLSGGGRGGNMLALVTPDKGSVVAQALQNAGAKHVFQTTLTT